VKFWLILFATYGVSVYVCGCMLHGSMHVLVQLVGQNISVAISNIFLLGE
jgi:hypothetical protein